MYPLPSIKGVPGAQSSGAALVSFNLDAFTSYGHSQGENAPVSEAAAFAYSTALNSLLTASGQQADGRPRYQSRVMLGETAAVFWAEYGEAESLMRGMIDSGGEEEEEESPGAGLSQNEDTETTKLRDVMRRLEDGIPLTGASAGRNLDPNTRVYVLGLSPNAARLSVRYWVEQTLGDFTAHFQAHWADLKLEPCPRFWPPPLWALLREIAPQRKSENIPSHLSGEIMRAILTGQPYPRALLAQTVMRIRADQDQEDRRTGRTLEKISDLRVALLKASLAWMYRSNQIAEDVPVSIDLTTTNSAYRLGCLFSVLERLQGAALGQRNATVRDRFYASASATPALVFPRLSATRAITARRFAQKWGRASRSGSRTTSPRSSPASMAAFRKPCRSRTRDASRLAIITSVMCSAAGKTCPPRSRPLRPMTIPSLRKSNR